jgi:hypothetical protein
MSAIVATASSASSGSATPSRTQAANASSWYVYDERVPRRSVRSPSGVRTTIRSSIWGSTKFGAVASPREPVIRMLISSPSYAMWQRAEPVAPPGNSRSASSHSSAPGAPARTPPRAPARRGGPPAQGASIRSACRL